MFTAKIIIFTALLLNVAFADVAKSSIKDTKYSKAKNVLNKEIVEQTKDEEILAGVYWRPWKVKNKVPADAVLGGYTNSICGIELPIYLGRIYVQDASGIQPTQILENTKSVKASYGGRQLESNKHIEVLCSKRPDDFTWVHINETTDYDFNDDCVVAGYELNFSAFYGRTKHDDEVIIAKALPKRKLMYFPYVGREKMTSDFEILCYKAALTKERTSENKSDEENDNQAPGYPGYPGFPTYPSFPGQPGF